MLVCVRPISKDVRIGLIIVGSTLSTPNTSTEVFGDRAIEFV